MRSNVYDLLKLLACCVFAPELNANVKPYFAPAELSGIPSEIVNRLVPEHARKQNFFMALDA